MPLIPNPIPVIAVKLIGYSLAGYALNKVYEKRFHPLLFGLLRVAAGLGAGLVTIVLFIAVSPAGGMAAEFIWIFLTRVLVWGVLIRVIFERGSFSYTRYFVVVFLGIVFSFCLDGLLYLLANEFPDYMKIPFC